MKLFYREFGSGMPLLILHGLFGLSDHWVGVAKKLERQFRVIIPDLRNHGQSPHHSTMKHDAMTEDLLELLRDLNISKITALGHSMGGKLAMFFALKNPQIIEKLIVVNIGTKAYRLSFNMKDLTDALRRINPASYKNRKELMAQLPYSEAVKSLIIKNLAPNLCWKPNVSVILKNMDSLTGEIEGESPYNGASFFLRGEHSDYILPQDFPEIVRLFPSSQFITISNSKHWIHADNPQDFVEEILNMHS